MKKLGFAFVALVAGSLIYILWRDKSLIMFTWFGQCGLGNIVELLRDWAEPFSVYIPTWILYSLPNSLWLFSGMLVFDSIWGPKMSPNKIFWLSFFLIIAIGGEIGQGFRLLPGTFDWQDLILMALGGFCSLLIVTYPRIRDERRQEI